MTTSPQRSHWSTPPVARAIGCSLLLTFGLPALSVAQTPSASEPRGDGIAGARSSGRQHTAAGAAADGALSAAAVATAARDRVPLALVLPLQSPLYGRAAEAVKAGFAAAAANSQRNVTT